MSTRSLMAFSLGLVAFMLIKVLAPGFYARQDTRSPVKYGVIAMGANTAMTLVLIWPLAHAGLALSTSLAAFLNAGLLFINLRRRDIYQPRSGWKKFLAQLTVANLAMGLALWFGAGTLESWIQCLLLASGTETDQIINPRHVSNHHHHHVPWGRNGPHHRSHFVVDHHHDLPLFIRTTPPPPTSTQENVRLALAANFQG